MVPSVDPSSPASGEIELASSTKLAVSRPLADLCAEITEVVRLRQDYVLAQGNIERQLKCIVRRLTGKAKVSNSDIDAYLKSAPDAARLHLGGLITVREYVKRSRRTYDKACEQLARMLPVYGSFVEPLHGFGAIGLALIVGEAGDLANYDGPAKLRKRFGLAPFNGRAGATWRRLGGLNKAQWEDLGYNPRRRSIMFVVVDSLLKKQNRYKVICDERKLLERQKAEADGLTVAAAADIPDGQRDKYRSLGHIKARAERYVAQRLLLDLWKAWRGETISRMSHDHRMIVSPSPSQCATVGAL